MSKDFRFFDSRQKYLLFVTTTNEKIKIAEKISSLVKNINPKKPALKIFDAGLGDGTLLTSVLRSCHQQFPTIPFLIFGKEISMEDVRLSIEKLSDRFMEHPDMVFVVTNLHYSESAKLTSLNKKKQEKINWETVKLEGNSSYEFNQQLSKLDEMLKNNWQVERHPINGNPTYKLPSALIIYRKDHEFSLDSIIPKKNETDVNFDLVIASQPYRSRISVEQKINYVIQPMINILNKGGKLALIHACGDDAGMEIIKKIWPDENPFPSLSKEIVDNLRNQLKKEQLKKIIFNNPEKFRYNLRALPNEIENGIATSLIFSSWNASTYVAQINDENIIKAEKEGKYLKHIQQTIKKHDGLWFNNEILIIETEK